MADAVSIAVEPRDPQKNKGTGSRVARKIRAAGRVPAIIYGHKQTPQPVSLSRDDAWLFIKKHAHLAELTIGSAKEMVLLRDIQWDHLGKEILHLDFARVSADEMIETSVALHFVGHAAGVAEGGVFEVISHEIPIRCRATAIPDEIRVDVSHLKIGEGIHVKDLPIPEGMSAHADPELLLAHVVIRGAAPEAAPAAEGPAEPELIGRKPAEDSEDNEKDKKGSK
jgi:large subunit ribosomal protein L25